MSWDQLVDIAREQSEWRRREAEATPVDCDRCGEVLAVSPAQERRCPFCGWSPQ